MNTSLFEAPSASSTELIRREIKARGLTAQQAAQKYGLGPDMMDWLTQNGISFAPEGARPQPGLMEAAAQGRNGDTMMAHVTPGEKVVPKEVAQGRPDVMANVDQAIAQIGADPAKYTVGEGSVNPATGAQEFATSVTDGQITDWLSRNPNASDAQIADVADSYGVTPERLAGATGGNPTEIRRRYDAVRAQAGTTTPDPTAPRTGVTPTTTGSTPVVTPGGGGLFSATGTNVTVPNAAQVTPNGPMGVSGATSQGYTANTAARAPDVVAGQGKAGSYKATTATAAPNVTAGTAQATDASSQGYQATDAQAALRPDASLWEVDNNSTVQGQIANITESGSPLMQRAETRALQNANKRGLANSSMAVTAGQAALYDAAMPIAQQDANTFAQSGQYNAGAKNERDQFNAGTQTQVNLTNAGERNKAAAFGADASNKTSMFNAENATKNSQFNVDKALQAGIVNQEQANKMAAINAEMINRAAEFNITTDAQMQQFNIDAALKAGVINQEQANKMAQFNTASINDAAKFTAASANEASQFNAAEANKVSMFQANLNADIAKHNASQSNDLLKLGMDSQTKVALAEIEANYKTLMQSSASGSEAYKQSIASIAQILQNNDMDAAAKQTAIQNITSVLNASLAVTGQIANLDLPELDFGGEPGPTPAPTAAPTSGGLFDAGAQNP